MIISVFVAAVFLLSRCVAKEVNNMKDLDENMLDIMTYHDNLGLYLRKEDADYATWLLTGMDSTLRVIAKKFTTHRKMTDPFEKAYRKKLKPPINGIRSALEKNNFPQAIVQYRLLTKKCNDCHIDYDVRKEVIDGSRGELH